ncbi:hypothetical protein AcW1_006649 [Taiwanofungus camphoratus]|nr:hypothetical protein AcW1_006649 [Antrodia cinnamomea]
MSFFGFEEQNDLEGDKRKFLESGSGGAHREDIAVYTWGEEGYDGLGDELQERGDELNDETFGLIGEVGKDFDFGTAALPSDDHPKSSALSQDANTPKSQAVESHVSQLGAPLHPSHTLESLWDDKSPFSVLPRINGASRASNHSLQQPSKSSLYVSAHTDALASQPSTSLSIGGNLHKGVRTVEEIEAEMRAAAAAQQQQQPQHHQPQPLSHALSQGQLRGQVQRQSTPQHTATPPPRMHPHSQSPRFHQQQQQHQIHVLQLQQQQQQQQQRYLLELQEQRERLQQQQLIELQEQLRLEELERQHQIRLQQIQATSSNHLHSQLLHQRHTSGGLSPSLSDRQQRRVGRQSPALMNSQAPLDVPFQQSMQYLPQDIQMQQRLLAEMAQAEFLSSMQATTAHSNRETKEERELQEALRVEAMRKIMEAERMEEKRRRKLAKITHMARYNDLMTQSDKDFITRIQVSQLVTQDPYTDDFYAQVYGAVFGSRLGMQSAEDRVLKFGSGGGVGLGLGQKGPGRRQSAMQRMEAQVERIVNNARMREKEKISLNSLQGALGRTSGRSYKAAPRQLLQVDSGNPSTSPNVSSHAHISKSDAATQDGVGAAREAAKIGREALGSAADTNGLVHKDPLTHRETLVILERLYDLVLEIEQRRREQPASEEEETFQAWNVEFTALVEQLWDGLRVMVPLEISDPHPFISLLTPIKGKRILPRVARHLSTQQMLTVLTLLVACFSQLDVVIQAPLLDSLDGTKEQADVEAQTQAFMASVVQSILPVVAKASLRLVSGLLGLLLDRSNIIDVARTRPGLALLTLFVSRVEIIKQSMSSATEVSELPSPEETEQWYLLELLSWLSVNLIVWNTGNMYSTIYLNCWQLISWHCSLPSG